MKAKYITFRFIGLSVTIAAAMGLGHPKPSWIFAVIFFIGMAVYTAAEIAETLAN